MLADMETQDMIVYFCSEPNCDERFFSEYDYEYHYIDHLPTTRFYTCTKCNYSSERREIVRDHLVCHFDVRPFACPNCGNAYKYKSDLGRHVKKCTQKPKAPQPQPPPQRSKAQQSHPQIVAVTSLAPASAPVVVAAASGQQNTVRSAPETSVPTSQITFTIPISDQSQSNIGAIVEEECDEEEIEAIDCDKCNSQFESVYDYKVHLVREHYPKQSNSYPCTEQGCSYIAQFPSRVLDHLLTHFDIYPYDCTECDFKCKFRSSLERHSRLIHNITGSLILTNPLRRPSKSTARQFICNYSFCADSFESEYDYKLHLFDHNPPQGVHKCPDCDYTSTVRGSVRSHIVSHYNVQPHKCPDCGTKYKRFLDLQLHYKTIHDKHLTPPPIPKIKIPAAAHLKLRQNDASVRIPEQHFLLQGQDQISFDLEAGDEDQENDPFEGDETEDPLTYEDESEEGPILLACSHPGCEATVSNDYELKVHMFDHQPQQNIYRCTDCTYTTPIRRSLKRHIVVHYDVYPFQCTECGAKYKYGQVLRIHMLKVHGKQFERTKDLPVNEPIIERMEMDEKEDLEESDPEPEPPSPETEPASPESTPKTTFKCPEKNCKVKPFDCEYEFKLHMFDHLPSLDLYICDFCNYRSVMRGHVRAHIVTHFNVRPFRCELCSATYRFRRDLRNHNKKVHDNLLPRLNEGNSNPTNGTNGTGAEPPKPFACTYPNCGKEYGSECNLKLHLFDHFTLHARPPFHCTECRFTSSQRPITRAHLQAHYQLKNHMDQQQHQQQHKDLESPAPIAPGTIERVFTCSICGKNCGNSIAVLNFHMRKAHARNTSNPKDAKSPIKPLQQIPPPPPLVSAPKKLVQNAFKCPEDPCEESFESEYLLTLHQIDHQPSGNFYQCPKCNLSNTNRFNLKEHLASHFDVRPWACEICQLTFKYRQGFRKHMREAHKINPTVAQRNKCYNIMVAKKLQGEVEEPKPKPTLLPSPPKIILAPTPIPKSPERKLPLPPISKPFRENPIEDLPCPDENCEEILESEYELQVHSVDHQSVSKRYTCPLPDCEFAISNRYDLKSHIAVHYPVRPFKCPELNCSMDFKYRKVLRHHMKHFHKVEIPRPAREGMKIAPISHFLRAETPSSNWKCKNSECTMSFPTEFEYKLHLYQHWPKNQPYKCHDCDYTHRYRELIKQHISKTHYHPRTQPHKCSWCGKRYGHTSGLLRHRRQCSGNPKNHAKTSSILQTALTMPKLTTMVTRKSYSIKKHPQLHICKICNRTFSFTSSLRRHRRLIHGLKPDGTKAPPKLRSESQGDHLQCKYCTRFYRNIESLRNHVTKFHRRKFKVPPPPQAKVLESEIEHETPPPILSPQLPIPNRTIRSQIPQKFNQTSEIPLPPPESTASTSYYTCMRRNCTQRFDLELDLKVHLTTHLRQDSVQFECSECELMFLQRADLAAHLSDHYSDELLQCRICAYNTFNIDLFREHTVTNHPDEIEPQDDKDYECTVCNLDFATERALDLHAEEVHGRHGGRRIEQVEDEFACMVCESVFMDNDTLLQHLRTHENNGEDVEV